MKMIKRGWVLFQNPTVYYYFQKINFKNNNIYANQTLHRLFIKANVFYQHNNHCIQTTI